MTSRMDDEDRRNKIVTLTALALTTGTNMSKVIGDMENKMLSSLSDKQVEDLTGMLETIYRNVS